MPKLERKRAARSMSEEDGDDNVQVKKKAKATSGELCPPQLQPGHFD